MRNLLRVFTQSLDGYLFDVAAGETSVADAKTDTVSGKPDVATKTDTAITAGNQEPVFTYKEKRDDWVEPSKFRAAERATHLASQRLSQLEAELVERDRRIAALAGTKPTTPAEREAAEVRAALEQVHPTLARLSKLSPEQLDRVLALADKSDQLIATTTQNERRHWDGVRDRMFSAAYDKVATHLGVEKLSDRQREKIDAVFNILSRRNADANDPEEGPYNTEFARRYEANDPTLVDDVVKELYEDFVQPAQRLATVPIAQRRPVPRVGNSAQLTTAKAKPDLSKMSVSEMLDWAEKHAEEQLHGS